jgi:hypothetical protein
MIRQLQPLITEGAGIRPSPPSRSPGLVLDRKQRKRQAKLQRDAVRPPESHERLKVLLEVIGEQRRVVDLEDHRARYATVIAGGINGALYLVGSRAVGSGWLPGAASPWAMSIGLAYVAVSALFILGAIDCLRPRILDRKGLLHWEGAMRYNLAEYETAWKEVRMDQLNREAVQIAHLLARMIDEKCRVNRRLYRWLTALTVLGAVVLTILAVSSSRG